MQIEIKYSDLNDEAKERISKELSTLGIDVSQTNWDTNPMAIINIEETEEN